VIELADGRQFSAVSANHIMIPRSGSMVVVAGPFLRSAFECVAWSKPG
jgi:hypothetical protein